jgi:3-oxoacid CoA-transferase B subunit
MTDVEHVIAARVATHLSPGEVVNLGIGIPTLVAEYLATGEVDLETENGVLGVGPAPAPEDVDLNLTNAGKSPITVLAGASYFSSSTSFGLIRGGHVNTAVLGTLQVDQRGRMANWSVPNKPILGVGGAMDLLVGAHRVVVATTHTTRAGQPKIVAECTYPITADRQVDLIVTEAATFAFTTSGLTLIEVAGGFSTDWVRDHTDASFACDDGLATSGAGIRV